MNHISSSKKKKHISIEESKKLIEYYAEKAIELMAKNENLVFKVNILKTISKKLSELIKSNYKKIQINESDAQDKINKDKDFLSNEDKSYNQFLEEGNNLKTIIAEETSKIKEEIKSLELKLNKLDEKLMTNNDTEKLHDKQIENFLLKNLLQEKNDVFLKMSDSYLEIKSTLSYNLLVNEIYLNNYLSTDNYKCIKFIRGDRSGNQKLSSFDLIIDQNNNNNSNNCNEGNNKNKESINNNNNTNNDNINSPISPKRKISKKENKKMKKLNILLNNLKEHLQYLKEKNEQFQFDKGYFMQFANKKFNKELILKFDNFDLLNPQCSSETENNTISSLSNRDKNDNFCEYECNSNATSSIMNISYDNDYDKDNNCLNDEEKLVKINDNIMSIKKMNSFYRNKISKYNSWEAKLKNQIHNLRESIRKSSLILKENSLNQYCLDDKGKIHSFLLSQDINNNDNKEDNNRHSIKKEDFRRSHKKFRSYSKNDVVSVLKNKI